MEKIPDAAEALRSHLAERLPDIPVRLGGSDASTLTVTDFVLARIAEDEAVARAVKPLVDVRPMGATGYDEKTLHMRLTYAGEDGYPRTVADSEAAAHYARHDPARVLAQCAAMRKVLMAANILGLDVEAAFALILAPIWAHHPDFNPGWPTGA